MGRVVDGTILSTYNNQLLRIWGYGARYTCVSENNTSCDLPIQGEGATWQQGYPLYYPSADCTGAPYVYRGAWPEGVAYGAMPFFDDGIPYLYIYRPSETILVAMRSFSQGPGACYAFNSTGMAVAPVTAVVPASTYGTPPFFMK